MATLWDENDNVVMEIFDDYVWGRLAKIPYESKNGKIFFTQGWRIPMFNDSIRLHVYKGYYLTL